MKANQDMTVERSQFQSSEVGAPKGDSDDAHWQDPFCSLDVGGLSGIKSHRHLVLFSCSLSL